VLCYASFLHHAANLAVLDKPQCSSISGNESAPQKVFLNTTHEFYSRARQEISGLSAKRCGTKIACTSCYASFLHHAANPAVLDKPQCSSTPENESAPKGVPKHYARVLFSCVTGDIWPQCDGHVGTLAGWIQCSSNQIGVLQKQSERRCFQRRDHASQQCNPATGFRGNIRRTANSGRRYGKRQFADSPPIPSSSFSSYNLTTRMRCLARKTDTEYKDEAHILLRS
jgi:hypothetical protein